jgi:hypothetical protein
LSRTCFRDCVKEVFFYTVFFHIVKEKDKKDDINNIFGAVLCKHGGIGVCANIAEKTGKSERIC